MRNTHSLLFTVDALIHDFLKEKVRKIHREKKSATITGLIREAIVIAYGNELGFPSEEALSQDRDDPSEKKLSREEKFWSHVQKSTEFQCWIWNLSGRQDGYAEFIYERKKVPAHRMAYALSKNGGNLPFEPVYHKCKNRDCVNPYHLYTKSDLIKENENATNRTEQD